MSAEIHILQNQDQSRILRLESMDVNARALLEASAFDGVEVMSSFGNIDQLAPFQERIRWLFAPQLISPDGLVTLESLERITFVGSQLGDAFDYRSLRNLKVFECGSAEEIPMRYLDHPSLEILNIAGANLKNFMPLKNAVALRALLVENSKIKSLDGLGSFAQLRELRLLGERSLVDINELAALRALEVLVVTSGLRLIDLSPIRVLSALRCLHIEAKSAEVPDIEFVTQMPDLQTMHLWAPVRTIDWRCIASHSSLCQIGLQLSSGGSFDSDETITAHFSAASRMVKTITRFSGVRPQIKIEVEPPAGKRQMAGLGNNLRSLQTPLPHARG